LTSSTNSQFGTAPIINVSNSPGSQITITYSSPATPQQSLHSTNQEGTNPELDPAQTFKHLDAVDSKNTAKEIATAEAESHIHELKTKLAQDRTQELLAKAVICEAWLNMKGELAAGNAAAQLYALLAEIELTVRRKIADSAGVPFETTRAKQFLHRARELQGQQ
jgi:hypothetical protein